MAEKLPTKKKPTTLYAIQRKRDGLYSRGGEPAKWGKFPKTWGPGPFKNHLLQFKPCSYYKRNFPYVECEVLQIDPEGLNVTNRFPAAEWVWENCYILYRDKEIKKWRSRDTPEFRAVFENWKKEYL